MLASVASTAAKHSAALVLFTTLLMRRLCHARRQYDPYLSHRKVTYAPCDPLSGRLAKLASVNVTILQAVWSTLVGKRRATSCPFTFRITLLAVYKSCTQASLMELATVQLSNAQSGLECVAIQLICPESCLRQVFSVGNRGLSRLVPVSPRYEFSHILPHTVRVHPESNIAMPIVSPSKASRLSSSKSHRSAMSTSQNFRSSCLAGPPRPPRERPRKDPPLAFLPRHTVDVRGGASGQSFRKW